MGNVMKNKVFKGFKLPKNVSDILEDLLEINGLSFSEYVRGLILQDLDRRSVFSTQLKAKLERTNTEATS